MLLTEGILSPGCVLGTSTKLYQWMKNGEELKDPKSRWMTFEMLFISVGLKALDIVDQISLGVICRKEKTGCT